jgi:hypothetical protein
MQVHYTRHSGCSSRLPRTGRSCRRSHRSRIPCRRTKARRHIDRRGHRPLGDRNRHSCRHSHPIRTRGRRSWVCIRSGRRADRTGCRPGTDRSCRHSRHRRTRDRGTVAYTRRSRRACSSRPVRMCRKNRRSRRRHTSGRSNRACSSRCRLRPLCRTERRSGSCRSFRHSHRRRSRGLRSWARIRSRHRLLRR